MFIVLTFQLNFPSGVPVKINS
ncbi:hypothetical protein HMPREF1531_00527, partial [Propionibacterium sp. oral taxon 192 str. F0372]